MGRMTKDKKDLRRLIREKRRDLDPVWIENKSLVVQRELMALPEFDEAEVVCCYLAMPGEVKTDRIIAGCRQKGKMVCVPAFRKDRNRYEPAEMELNTAVVEGPLKAPEPAEQRWVSIKEVDLMVVPGVAFDPSCGRVGHGKGYYDIMMGSRRTAKKNLFKVGLTFEFQVFEKVPMSERDVRLDAVITEERAMKSGL